MTLTETISAALARGAIDEAFAQLEPAHTSVGTDRDATLAWLRALAAAPRHPALETTVERAVAIEPLDVEVVIAACAALNAAAARRPLDAPPREGGPEARAYALARAALDALGEDDDSEAAAYLAVNAAQAAHALGPEHDGEAVAAYERALAILPAKGQWWNDFGVLHKWRGRWQPAFDAFLRARARLGDQRGVLWNAAIAATALGEGDVAAGLWRDLGFPVRLSSGGMPIVDDVPPRAVRVPSRDAGYGFERGPEQSFEVAWVTPLSPCHGVVSSATFRDAPIDYGDLVLWDGAPVANDPPVFPLLEILKEGDERRLRFATIVREGDLAALGDAMPEGVKVFAHPAGREVEGERLAYGKLVVPASVDLASVRQKLEEVARGPKGHRFAIPGLYEATGPSKRAGQEHQAWRALERAALQKGLVEGELRPETEPS
ncbi:MAG: hypothetical protein H6721_16335 [Sandaracinus sp.]|nr:hypothetical protein [Sandaracinus sp.]